MKAARANVRPNDSLNTGFLFKDDSIFDESTRFLNLSMSKTLIPSKRDASWLAVIPNPMNSTNTLENRLTTRPRAKPVKLPLESCLITSAFNHGLDSVATGLGEEAA